MIFPTLKLSLRTKCSYLTGVLFVLVLSFVITPLKASQDSPLVLELQTSPMEVINTKIREGHSFYGLAAYYEGVNYYIVDSNSMEVQPEERTTTLSSHQWLVIAGRFNVLAIQAPGLSFNLDNENIIFHNADVLSKSGVKASIVEKPQLGSLAPELNQVRYAHLWAPFAWLSMAMESILVFLHDNISTSWAITIILFALLLRGCLFPVTIMTSKIQRNVDEVKSKLNPTLEAIKSQCKGAEAHEKIMAAHKELGVSPFYTLKPMIGPIIQIPLLIAIFNAMGEMPQFAHSSTWWIWDWAYPDTVLTLPFSVPLLGNELNVLPFLMTSVTIIASMIYTNPKLPPSELKKTKRNIYFMAFGFFLLFYSFPAAMVFFWMVMNILQTTQQKITG